MTIYIGDMYTDEEGREYEVTGFGPADTVFLLNDHVNYPVIADFSGNLPGYTKVM